MKSEEDDVRRLLRISRAVGIERKEVRDHLERLEGAELVEKVTFQQIKGRGGHPVVHWNITEPGRMWRGDLGRLIQLGIRLGYYPDSFFYLPSDAT